MRSKKERSYSNLSDLGKVATRIEKFAKRAPIFCQGDTAETVMYIQKGRVEFSVASKCEKEAVVGDSGRCRSVFRGMPITRSGMMAITIPG